MSVVMSRSIRRRSMSLHARRSVTGVGFLLPWLIGVLVFFIQPIVLSIRFSFNQLTIDEGYTLTRSAGATTIMPCARTRAICRT